MVWWATPASEVTLNPESCPLGQPSPCYSVASRQPQVLQCEPTHLQKSPGRKCHCLPTVAKLVKTLGFGPCLHAKLILDRSRVGSKGLELILYCTVVSCTFNSQGGNHVILTKVNHMQTTEAITKGRRATKFHRRKHSTNTDMSGANTGTCSTLGDGEGYAFLGTPISCLCDGKGNQSPDMWEPHNGFALGKRVLAAWSWEMLYLSELDFLLN